MTAPLFAKYQPQAVRTVPGGYHATCAAAVCIKPRRIMYRGAEYIINADRKAEHLECNNAAEKALLKQAQLDAESQQPKGESSTG